LTAEETADNCYKNDILMPTIRDFMALLTERPYILDFGCGPAWKIVQYVASIKFISPRISAAEQRIRNDFPPLSQKPRKHRQLHGCQRLEPHSILPAISRFYAIK
jgi:hypothetical protein